MAAAASIPVQFPSLPGRRITRSLILVTILCTGLHCGGQQPASSTNLQGHQSPVAQGKSEGLVVPVGTKISLVLTHPIESKSTHRGDLVDAQTTSPVIAGEEIAIPPGSFVQGKLEKLTRKHTQAEIELQSASVIFPNGYVAVISGPLTVESDEWTALREPGKGSVIGAIAAPSAGLLAGSLIGHAAGSSPGMTVNGVPTNASSVKDTAIGGFAGLAVGGAVALVLFMHSHQFLVDAGSPMNMVLQQPLMLDESRLAGAARQMQANPVLLVQPVVPRAPEAPQSSGTCYTPGTPGTPPIVIPGTPPIGDAPGTPDVVIPGTPPIPGTAYPCP